MSETDRFDSLLMNIAQTQRGIEPLLDTVFSFLRRKTDFFTGASPEMVEETILKCVRKQAHVAEKDQLAKKQQEDEKRRKKAAEDALKKKKKDETEKAARAAAAAVEPPRFEEIVEDDEPTPVVEAKQSVKQEEAKEEEAAVDADKEEDEEDSGPRTLPALMFALRLMMCSY